MALAASRFLGISFSFSAHASGDIFVKPILLPEKLAQASFVVAVCEYSKKYLDSVTGYKYSGKIFRVYNSIDISEPEKLMGITLGGKEELEGSHDEIRIVSVGRLLGCKGFGTLIMSCNFLKERGYEITCEIIGEGPDLEIFRNLTWQLGLQNQVFFAGSLPLREVYQALAKADIFALLSEIHLNGYRDAFPTVVLEAMVMSLPVVSTWVSGIPEMVIHGKTGLLVHERDAIEAAKALEILIKNDKMRLEFGRAGRQRVLQIFNLRKQRTWPIFFTASAIIKDKQPQLLLRAFN